MHKKKKERKRKEKQYAREITVQKVKSFGFPKYEIKLQVPALNGDLMHTIQVMKIKYLQFHQQYLNLSTPPRLFFKKN